MIFFLAVIFDEASHKVHLITDRYGMRYLYWRVSDGVLFWSSELKGFVPNMGYTPSINQQAVRQFIEIGYVLEDNTWFEDIELLSSASGLSFDVRSRDVNKHRYWWWDRIELHSREINEREIAEEMGDLIVDAVRRR